MVPDNNKQVSHYSVCGDKYNKQKRLILNEVTLQ